MGERGRDRRGLWSWLVGLLRYLFWFLFPCAINDGSRLCDQALQLACFCQMCKIVRRTGNYLTANEENGKLRLPSQAEENRRENSLVGYNKNMW